MKVRNLTPHAVVLRVGDTSHTFPPDPAGSVRVTTEVLTESRPHIGPESWPEDWPLVFTKLGEPVGLPEREVGTVLIVSRMVRDALNSAAAEQGASWRPDVVCPDTGPDSVVRDDAGRIVAVRRFSY